MDMTSLGEAVLSMFAKVERKNGTVSYFKVVDGEHKELTEEEYLDGNRPKMD